MPERPAEEAAPFIATRKDEVEVANGFRQLLLKSRAPVSFIGWLFWTIYLFGMPFWAWVGNDYLRYFNQHPAPAYNWTGPQNYFCMTPPSEMRCINVLPNESTAYFEEVAAARMNISGRHDVGCGCGQGLFGENLCPQDRSGYTLSSFTSTSFAIVLWLLLSIIPTMSTWYGTDLALRRMKPSSAVYWAIWIELALFQLSFWWFAAAQDCVMLTAHLVTTGVYTAALAAHGLTLLYVIWQAKLLKQRSRILIGVVAGLTSLAGPLFTTAFWFGLLDVTKNPSFVTWFNGNGVYLFYLIESYGLSMEFLIGPTVLLIEDWNGWN